MLKTANMLSVDVPKDIPFAKKRDMYPLFEKETDMSIIVTSAIEETPLADTEAYNLNTSL